MASTLLSLFFFFNDTATTEIYTLSLHDALPIFSAADVEVFGLRPARPVHVLHAARGSISHGHRERRSASRSEEHTSELQSPCNLVCRLLLEKKRNYSVLLALVIHDHGHLLSLLS